MNDNTFGELDCPAKVPVHASVVAAITETNSGGSMYVVGMTLTSLSTDDTEIIDHFVMTTGQAEQLIADLTVAVQTNSGHSS